MNIIKDKTTLKAIAKKFNLEFCPKFGYYDGDAYKDSKGNYLPTYMYHNGRVFGLKFFDGCFHPFLVEYKINNFALIFTDDTKKVIERVVLANNPLAKESYSNKYGTRFSML